MKPRMHARRHFVALALVLGLTMTGCDWFHRRKPQPIPPQAQAPTTTQPEPATQPATTTTTTAQPPQPEPEKPADTTAQKPKPRTKPAPAHAKKIIPAPAATPAPPATKPTETASATPPPRIVISEGSTPDGSNAQISSPNIHSDAGDHELRTTQQLLDSTDANLRNLKRALSTDEKAMVDQIHAYMQQSRDATKDGDAVRAHNLALKAHLLSDELVKR